MPSRKILQRLRNIGKEFYGMVSYRMSEAVDLAVQLRCDRLYAKPLKRINERMRKALQAITMLHDALSLDVIMNLAHLFGRKFVVFQE